MTTIYIKDTGVIKPGEEDSGTYPSADITNAGEEIPLKVIQIRYARGIAFDNTPVAGSSTSVGSYKDARLNFVSINNPLITLKGQIKTKGDLSSSGNAINQITEGGTTSIKNDENTDTSNEVQMLFLLDKLSKTKGYKELYYKEDVANNSIYGLGVKDNHTTEGAAYRHLHVRVKGIDITETPGTSLISWNLICELDRGE